MRGVFSRKFLTYRRYLLDDLLFRHQHLMDGTVVDLGGKKFNPRGEFGERHLHTLPHRVLPKFDPDNEAHLRIAEIARSLAAEVQNILERDRSNFDPGKAIHARRRKLRSVIEQDERFSLLEDLCAATLGTSSGGAIQFH